MTCKVRSSPAAYQCRAGTPPADLFAERYVRPQICKIEIEKEKTVFLKDHAEAKHPKVRCVPLPGSWGGAR